MQRPKITDSELKRPPCLLGKCRGRHLYHPAKVLENPCVCVVAYLPPLSFSYTRGASSGVSPLAPDVQSFSLLPSPFRLRLLRTVVSIIVPFPTCISCPLASPVVCVPVFYPLSPVISEKPESHGSTLKGPSTSRDGGGLNRLIMQYHLFIYYALKTSMHVSSRYWEYWFRIFGGI